MTKKELRIIAKKIYELEQKEISDIEKEKKMSKIIKNCSILDILEIDQIVQKNFLDK